MPRHAYDSIHGMNFMTTRLALNMLFTVAAGLALIGCGKGAYKVAPVSGKITLDGQPLANVNVVFQPSGTKSSATPGPGSAATTDAQGQYTLRTMEEPSQPGAVVGPHVVSFTPAVQKPIAGREVPAAHPQASKIPSAPLNFEVPAAGTSAANFDLKSAAPSAPGRGGVSARSS